MASQIFLATLLFLPLLLFFLMKKKSSQRLPPGSLGVPIIGHTLQLGRAMRGGRGEEWLQERAKKYGPISKMHLFGTPTVFLHGQAGNKFIYSCDETTLSNQQPRVIGRLIGERNLFELSGKDHRRVRGAMLSFLKPEALKQSVEKMDQEIRLHFNQHWHHNQEIKAKPLMKALTFNVICTLLFGLERGERRDELVIIFEDVVDGVLSLLPLNLPFTRFSRSLRARWRAEVIIRELMEEKRQKLKSEEISGDDDLITTFLSMRDEAGSPLLSDEEIVDNCVLAMIAGHDTTSSLLTVMIKLLSEQPHVYQAVAHEQEEIARAKKKSSDPLTWEDLAKMKYTWRVAMETLRLYSPVMFGFRRVLRDIEFGGYVIPKGWQVFWAGCMTHLDESIYPDPYKINPMRYENHGATPPHTYIAFGAGPRMCPGNELARIETLTMIHYFVTGFKWKLCLEDNVMKRDPLPAFDQGMPMMIQIKNP